MRAIQHRLLAAEVRARARARACVQGGVQWAGRLGGAKWYTPGWRSGECSGKHLYCERTLFVNSTAQMAGLLPRWEGDVARGAEKRVVIEAKPR